MLVAISTLDKLNILKTSLFSLSTPPPLFRCASRRWARLSENEKKPWHSLAEQEKLAHREAFPEYRYCPRRTNPNGSVAPKRARSVDIKDPIQMYSTSLPDSRFQKKVKRGSK